MPVVGATPSPACSPDQRSNSPSAMTSRERILAALNREPVDRIPFVPLLDYYTLRDMPSEIPSEVIGAARALGCDLMLRHVPVTSGGLTGYLRLPGSGDTTPRSTPVENLRVVRDLVEELGSY